MITTKSFYMMGKSLNKCLGCDYCRLLGYEQVSNYIYPTDISPMLLNIPVAVNLFYGDPFIQTKETFKILRGLEQRRHRGPVVIITKAPIQQVKELEKFELDLHVCVSVFGVDHPIDKGSLKTFESNLEKLSCVNIRKSIEFRPVIHGINDSVTVIDYVFKKARDYKMPVAYSALQVKQAVADNLKCKGFNVKPFPGKDFHTHLKPMDNFTHKKFKTASLAWDVPVFRKTSCLLSYQHKKNRDFNCHYYRINDVSCGGCPMFTKCHKYKKFVDEHVVSIGEFSYEHEIVKESNYKCRIADTCKSATKSCFNISGTFIRPLQPITRGDARLTKWLTGIMPDGDIIEDERISDFWKNYLSY